MIDVKKPVLLDDSLQPVRVLEPQNVSITLNSPGVSQATIVLGPDDPEPAMHALVEVFNVNGSAGIFRVSVPSQDYAQQQSIVLRHGIDTMADSHFIGQEDFSGTAQQLLGRIMGFQTTRVNGQAPWQLGTCECTSTLKYSINYDRLSDLLAKIEEDEPDYYFAYDQSSFPWTLSFLAKPAEADGEFRLNRNVRTISRTLNDNDLCTQLILSVNVAVTDEATGSGITPGDPSYTPTPGQTDADTTGITATSTTTETVIRTYDNTDAQAAFGIVQRTADIDTNDNIAGGSFTEADAWAARFLAQHATPTMQLQIDGDELKRLTGDSWDEAKLGHICRVELPKYSQSFAQRVVSVTYPEAIGDPTHVTVSLATQLPRFSSSISSLKKAEAATAKAARGVGRGAAKAKEMKQWSMVVTDQQLALDGTGITQLYETGISMDARGGAKIYSLDQGVQSLYSGIEVQAGRIDLVVQGNGSSASIKIQAIVDGINGSQIDINADRIALNGSTSIADVMEINSGGGLWVKRLAIFGSNGGVSINNGTVNATNLQVGSGGTLTFVGGSGGYTALSRSDVLDFVTGFGNSSESGGQITIPYYSVGVPPGSGSAAGSINFNIAATQFYSDTLAAFSTALGDAGWNGNHDTLVSATLDTTNKRLTVNSAVANVTLPGQSSATQYIIGLGNLDLTTPLTNYYNAAEAAGQASVSALIVDGNNTPYSGQRAMAGGTTLTIYPATYIGGVTERNTSAALVITAEDGADSVGLVSGYDSNDPTETATISQIVYLGADVHGVYVDVHVGVRLSNGKQYQRWITDINTGFTFFGDRTLFSYDSTDEDYTNEGRRNWYYK